MRDQEIETIELSMDEARKLIRLKDMALRLAENPDFKELIRDGYFVEEAARLVHVFSDPNLVAQRDEIARDMHAIGTLKRFLHLRVLQGRAAERELPEHESNLQELRAVPESDFEVDDRDPVTGE